MNIHPHTYARPYNTASGFMSSTCSAYIVLAVCCKSACVYYHETIPICTYLENSGNGNVRAAGFVQCDKN